MNNPITMLKSYLAILCAVSFALLTGCATTSKTAHEQKIDHGQTVTVTGPVKNVRVVVNYQGGVFYHVQVNNTLPTSINLVWDESTYVTTTGESVRLIYLPGKSELPEYAPAQQAISPIPPNSKFQADFTGEEWLDCARRNCKPHPKNSVNNASIYLTFNIKGKRVRWQGEISFAPLKQP